MIAMGSNHNKNNPSHITFLHFPLTQLAESMMISVILLYTLIFCISFTNYFCYHLKCKQKIKAEKKCKSKYFFSFELNKKTCEDFGWRPFFIKESTGYHFKLLFIYLCFALYLLYLSIIVVSLTSFCCLSLSSKPRSSPFPIIACFLCVRAVTMICPCWMEMDWMDVDKNRNIGIDTVSSSS